MSQIEDLLLNSDNSTEFFINITIDSNSSSGLDVEKLLELVKNYTTKNDTASSSNVDEIYTNPYSFYLLKRENGINLNLEYNHSSYFMTACYLVMATFVYYVPRTIYIRISRATREQHLPGFIFIWYLSIVACLSGPIHFAEYQADLSRSFSNDSNSTVANIQDTFFTTYITRSLAASINRVVSPAIGILCLQQITTHSDYGIPLLHEEPVQVILCVAMTIFVFGYSFLREYFYFAVLDANSPKYPDRFHVDMYDIIVPLITSFLFYFARKNLSRQSVYNVEKCGPNGPTTLDKVSKPIVFQAAMLFAMFIALFSVASEEEELCLDPEVYLFPYSYVAAQTPVVHWMLFRSLLRTRKSTRVCCLMCCVSGEKITPEEEEVEEEDVEAKGDNDKNDKNKKNNEDAKKKDNTQKDADEEEEDNSDDEPETLDANKIDIMSPSQTEELVIAESSQDPQEVRVIVVNEEKQDVEQHDTIQEHKENQEEAENRKKEEATASTKCSPVGSSRILH
ncbi:RGS domain-containing protein [Caenorhabditis elegans]|uniref:RGS domain-containing protein n=1 Tax=Caenorhabditis elegans TaxID=6239 RepID=D0IMZ2_CAEEL|nr:RGS domain-containing protein [Caenorhabditis elegans]CCD63299.2 RGS domain-containing protein [Caenorhabditis elegans]|eukprot:NP_001255223.2 Uncharacterized protein CELE_C18H7.12 [Caenorhabditis elegans]